MTAWNWPLLALDSSGPVASVVLATSPGHWHARQTPAGQAQASQLLPMAEAVLQEAGLRWADLGGLVVCHGPGSFTGLRMAVGLAQGLGFSRGLKIHLVSAFEAVAMAALASSNGSHAQQRDQLFDIRFDARLGEAFRGVVHWRAHLQQLSLVGDPRVVPVLEEGLSGATLLAQDSHPTGMTLAAQVMKVAELRLVAGPPGHPATVMPVAAQPLYVRDRVAQTLAERAVSASLVLIPMHRNDIASIMVIEKQAYSHPWTSGNFEDSLAAGYEGLKLVEQGAMVGYLVWMPVVQEAHLLNFTIAPARQRRGLGQWMLDQLMRTLTQQGFERLLLEVRPSNRSAVRLYQRNGFTEVGTRRGYYPAESGRREDAVVFARALAEVSTA
ncbi:MAG: ribosomal protein S18-alanine N-acetyltransferase [Burkholderiaceae bacterium]|jgi:ribosomal-protein-alanine acetyltransferase/tRNA threonylcarbamoyl adenosine modification protein YeaZ